jgi:hypothetical protein
MEDPVPGPRRSRGISTLEQLVARLSEIDLPGDVAPSEIVRRTKEMQLEGQGVWRSQARPEDRWTLLWVELGRS